MADASIRDSRGEWQPENLPSPTPLFRLPPKPLLILKYLFGPDGLILPWNALYLGLGVLSWLFLTPSMERMSTFAIDWIALIYLRNAGLMFLVFGSLHLRLYIKRAQGTRYKYTNKWLATRTKKFLFKNQTLDNMFWSLISGCGIWTAYESLTLWAYANKLLPFVDWATNPVYCTLLLIAVAFMRDIHFYWIHRFSHWKPLYRAAHFLHHKNVNIGPWSGMSMHPIEHILYLSGIFLHWIIPSHPIHAIAHVMHAGLSPAKGHTGFYKVALNGEEDPEKERVLNSGGYFHYLHHKYFTVNFGSENVPLDKWFGSWHDGTPDAHDKMMDRRKKKKSVI